MTAPIAKKSKTVSNPALWEAKVWVISPKRRGAHEGGRLTGEGEETKEFILLVGRYESAEERATCRLVGTNEDADQNARQPEDGFVGCNHSDDRRHGKPRESQKKRLPPADAVVEKAEGEGAETGGDIQGDSKNNDLGMENPKVPAA